MTTGSTEDDTGDGIAKSSITDVVLFHNLELKEVDED